ncbi:6-hydroxymethylpterin diphosphokinase MptE-like protein [Sinorhizobium alkalisoli]|uniref:6-hydroxymethylpterin diphosphokinase MptE-like domain-containing protein n=1 Tax=Sinorhizobium alkalisoli TaxID=1752398 RepID=A0A1E3V5E0_9HYPH|nr:6-hydroxymethylpterin diphosphokinase MptE-like protein [Sinorhizobium alkalisoli]ODR88361.1 hypothetical protein A8M32_25465 [Sinorhizobium alkalisoli]
MTADVAKKAEKKKTLWRRVQERYQAFVRHLSGRSGRVTAADRRLLESLRNCHAGRRGFIIGNGPSLRVADLDRLKNEVTFASNKIYLAFKETEWRPTYYTVEDNLVMLQNRREIEAIDGPVKLFPSIMMTLVRRRRNEHIYRYLRRVGREPLCDPDFPGFSTDAVKGIEYGSTVVYSQIQLAVHMGIKTIYLLGLDHRYEVKKVGDDGRPIADGERNHFHSEYRRIGERWNPPNLEVLEVSYRKARDICAVLGVQIVNCSRSSALDIFECNNLDTVLELDQTQTSAKALRM